jgi:hypothetical protein
MLLGSEAVHASLPKLMPSLRFHRTHGLKDKKSSVEPAILQIAYAALVPNLPPMRVPKPIGHFEELDRL